MSEENAQKKNKFRPVVFGCLIPSAGFLVLAIIAALLLSRAEPPGKKPEYIKSAEPRIEQRISNVEKKILEHASDSYDPDTTVMALFSMETALRNAGNFEQLTQYIVQESPEKVAPEIQLLKYRFFNVYKKLLSNKDSEADAKSIYRTAQGALLDFASTVDPLAFTYSRAQAQKIWEKHQAQVRMDADLRRRIERNQDEIVDFLFEFMTLSSKYYKEWEQLCALRDRAYLAAWEGSRDEVIANASAAVRLAPDEKEAHILLIMALLERNREDDLAVANGLIDDFLEKYPDNASGYLLRGVAKVRGKHLNEAATDFAQAAVYFPKQQEELSNRLGVYRKRAYLNKSMEGRIIVNAYRAMMSGSGYFSPDFQLARLMLEDGRKTEARKKIFDHFFRRRMQGEWDKVLDDFRFSYRFLNTDLFKIDDGSGNMVDIAIDSAFFTNSVILKVTNTGGKPLHNVTILLCVRFTDMFKKDYISFPVGETLALLKPGQTVEIGRRNIGEVSENILGMKKKFKDIIEFAAVMISDETISWIESKNVGEILPEPVKEKKPLHLGKAKTTADVLTEKAKEVVKDAVNSVIDKTIDKLNKPVKEKPETESKK
ncbi:MAG: hypothetical protein V8T87_11510 [Victivallales bacterium]